MKKKNTKSFADLAKAITKKYEKRLGEKLDRPDKYAVAAMNKELSELMEAQENQKAAETEAAYQTQMKRGGYLPQMFGGGIFPDDDPYSIMKAQNAARDFRNYADTVTRSPYVNNPMISNPTSNPPSWYYGNKQQQNKTYSPTQSTTSSSPAVSAATKPGIKVTPKTTTATRNTTPLQMFQPKGLPEGIAQSNPTGTQNRTIPNKIDNLPPYQKPTKDTWLSSVPTESWIGMGAQLAGTIGSALLKKKPEDVKLQKTAMPDYVPSDNDEAIRQANLAYMDSEAALRSASPSMYYAAMSKLATDRARTTAGLEENNANQNAAGMNAWNAQRAQFEAQQNAQQMAGDEMNVRNQMYYNDQMSNIPSELMGVVAGGMRDKLAYDQQAEALPWMSTQNYLPITDSTGKTARGIIAHPKTGTGSYKDRKKGMIYFTGGDPTNIITLKEFQTLINT
jgi:hypothetical protein